MGLGLIAIILLIVFAVRYRKQNKGGLSALNRVIVQQSNEGGWADASSMSMTDPFAKISVSQVVYGGVRAKAEGNVVVESKSSELLQVYIRIENVSSNKLPYQSWFGNSFRVSDTTYQAELTDNGNRAYSMMSKADFQSIQGHKPKAVLEPGDEISDVIIFAVPRSQLGSVQHFHLELPSLAYGGSKKSRFEIPRSMIKQ
jgi:hypothetical protein